VSTPWVYIVFRTLWCSTASAVASARRGNRGLAQQPSNLQAESERTSRYHLRHLLN